MKARMTMPYDYKPAHLAQAIVHWDGDGWSWYGMDSKGEHHSDVIEANLAEDAPIDEIIRAFWADCGFPFNPDASVGVSTLR